MHQDHQAVAAAVGASLSACCWVGSPKLGRKNHSQSSCSQPASHSPVVKDDICGLQELKRAHGQEAWISRSGADQVNLSGA